MTDFLFWIIVVFPLLVTYWAYGGLRDFIHAYRTYRRADGKHVLPVDREGLERYARAPFPSLMRIPLWTLTTFQVVAARQPDPALERLRTRYLFRLGLLAVAWIASFGILLTLIARQ